MDCPKCNNAMSPVEFGTDIKVNRCVGCGGIFCKRDVLARMRDEWMVHTVLDTGSAARGGQTNDIRDISCPGCGATMDHISDVQQSHIILDVCASCEGVFLDAGELTDLKHVTLMDHVRRLLSIFDRKR